MATKITFRSRKDAVNVYAEDKAQAEGALSNYLGISYGGLEMGERANAEQYYASDYSGDKRGVELIRTETIPAGAAGNDEDEEVELEVGTYPLDKFLN